jgi:hypothetical protein
MTVHRSASVAAVEPGRASVAQGVEVGLRPDLGDPESAAVGGCQAQERQTSDYVLLDHGEPDQHGRLVAARLPARFQIGRDGAETSALIPSLTEQFEDAQTIGFRDPCPRRPIKKRSDEGVPIGRRSDDLDRGRSDEGEGFRKCPVTGVAAEALVLVRDRGWAGTSHISQSAWAAWGECIRRRKGA